MKKTIVFTVAFASCFHSALSSPLSTLSFAGIQETSPSSSAKALLEQSDLNSQANSKISEIIQYGKTFIGTPYVYGGTTPKGFDCSGLVQYVYKHADITLPRTSRAQYQALTKVDEPEIGDLVFFSHGKRISHVGIYVGDNKMLHAPSTGKRVEITSMDNAYWQKRYAGARRINDARLIRDSIQIVAKREESEHTDASELNLQLQLK